MPCQREGGRPIPVQVVAFLALIEVGCAGELCLVLVLVAVGALGKFDLVQRRASRRDVTALALHRRVFPLQWIRARRMLFHRERGWLESLHGVASGTLAAVGALYELPAVRIRLMTIRAVRIRDWFLEIRARVTGIAPHADVFAEQRILSLRVVEIGRASC